MNPYSFQVSVDEDRNLLRITQRGFATIGDMRELEAAYRGALQQVRPGFILLNDQCDLEGIADDAQPTVERLVQITNQEPIGRLIRVVPAALVASARLGKLLVKGGFAYKTISVDSLAEAERIVEADRGKRPPG